MKTNHYTAYYLRTGGNLKGQVKFHFYFYGTPSEAYKEAAKILRNEKTKFRNLAVIPFIN